MQIIKQQEEIIEQLGKLQNSCATEVDVYSVIASLVPRHSSVGSKMGRELEAYKVAVVHDGISCTASAWCNPVRSTCP